MFDLVFGLLIGISIGYSIRAYISHRVCDARSDRGSLPGPPDQAETG
jgi:hypothetical protein